MRNSMPLYLYRDLNKHDQWIAHRMLYGTAIVCMTCGEAMWRVPLAPLVNWNGDRGGRLPLAMKRWLSDAPRRRDEFLMKKEMEHGNR